MAIARRYFAASVAVVAAAFLGACGAQPEMPTGEQSTQDGDLIGGFDSRGKAVSAIGTVGMLDRKGNYGFFCSATLVGPSTVLTAKHCAIVLGGPLDGMKLVNLVPIYFALGAEANKPERIVEAVAADLSPVKFGGFVGLGNDVAVYHLATPITDVEPMAVADVSLESTDVGQPFASVGFGSQDNYEDISGDLSATRKAGKTTLRALEGKSFELMLGSYEAFLEQMVALYGQEVVDEYADFIASWYNDTVILKGYEAWTGYVAGESQTCHGDSGGPLVRRVNGESKIYGVVSGGWFSSQLSCDYGTFYATLGDKTREMITKAYSYSDPCSDLTVEGVCSGDVATRCSRKWEGDRRKLEMDCGLVGQVCAKTAEGIAGCYDADQINASGVAEPRELGVEICDNSIDDNANGLIDCSESACQASAACIAQAQNTPSVESVRSGVARATRVHPLPKN